MTTTTSPLNLELTKRKDIVLNLKKEKGLLNVISNVILVEDYSGSMSTLYSNGTVQKTIERILPLGLAFDDNGEVDAYIFNDSFRRLEAPVTLANYSTYVRDQIESKRWNMGSTKYAPIINQIVKDFGNPTSGGGLFSSKKIQPAEMPKYVIFITDGNNDGDDKTPAIEAIKAASYHGIFFQFVGIGSSSFPFLEKLDTMEGRFMDNANFFKVPDLTRITDEDLYKLLMAEFPLWYVAAKRNNVIK